MRNRIWIITVALLVGCCAWADYEISWYSIDGGGGTSTGGRYSLTGTVGQADTGVSSGGSYVLSTGFWPGSFGCVVNLTDLAIMAEYWLDVGAVPADLDNNGRVDLADFAEISHWWYTTCPPDWPLK
ncbi:MAG: hypothetical protein ACOYLD_09170 [Anaerohalosphaeraceae bacterium]|jgi:hypothetical protein